jgi:ABC-type glutathione transport system ATPase component
MNNTTTPTRTGTEVEFRNVGKVFTQGKHQVTALDDVSITVPSGSIVGIIGYSGAGKSTLVRQINGLDKPTSGEVLLDGRDIVPLNERQLREIRRNIGMIFQQFNLLSSRTVAGNIAYPLKLQGISKTGTRSPGHRATQLRRSVRQGTLLPRTALRRPEAARGHRPGTGRPTRPCCWPTRRRPPWTPPPPVRSWNCCVRSTRTSASPSW